jgi:hypothetical protein
MKKVIFLLSISFTFILTGFQTNRPSDVFGVYTYKETTSDLETSHRIELKKEDLCTWQTVTKRKGKKEKCKRTGNFKFSENKITITWSKNECEDCGTYANWYGNKECKIDILNFRENSLWTTDKTPIQFIRTK